MATKAKLWAIGLRGYVEVRKATTKPTRVETHAEVKLPHAPLLLKQVTFTGGTVIATLSRGQFATLTSRGGPRVGMITSLPTDYAQDLRKYALS